MSVSQSHSGSGHNLNLTINASEEVARNPSILSEIINKLGTIPMSDEEDESSAVAFDIQQKIAFNNLSKYAPIIEEHKVFHGKLSTLYDVYEAQGTNEKFLLLKRMRNLYLQVRGELNVNTQLPETIPGDEIFEKILSILRPEIRNSANITASIEAIELGLYIVLVDAFMRCKILEVPR